MTLWIGAPHGIPAPCQVGGYRHYGRIDMFSVFHVIYQDQVIKESSEYMDSSPLR